MSENILKRRELIKNSFLKAVGVIGITSIAGASVQAADVCKTTSPQPEGPFFPIQDQIDKNNDLINVAGRNGKALGEVIILRGVVKDENCQVVAGALVEIWQACASGKYNHPGDTSENSLDPNFQYWGQAITDENGKYSFRTVKPGSYLATSDWVRPPHIHMKIQKRGVEELTTQVYFAEEKLLNPKDRILRSLSNSDQKDVVVTFKQEKQEGKILKKKIGNRIGYFNATLKNV